MPTPGRASGLFGLPKNGVVRVAFYGDSIVTGWRGISAIERRWTSLVSALLGWDEVNCAANGLGFVRWRGPGRTDTGEPLGLIDDVIAAEPDLVVVSLGTNDIVVAEHRGADVRAAMRRDLHLLSERYGTNRVLVLEPYWPRVAFAPVFEQVRSWLREATAAAGLTYLEGQASVVAGRAELLCADGVHPNDAGHAALAAFLGPRLDAWSRGQRTTAPG